MNADDEAALLAALAQAEAERRRDAWKALAMLILGPTCLFVGAIATVLFLIAETAPGRAMGLGFGGLCGAALLRLFLERRAPARALGGAVMVALGAFGFACVRAPDGAVVAPNALRGSPGLQSVWIRDFPRFGLANLTPERDQGRLATWLMPLVDPMLDFTEAAGFRGAVSTIYAELETEPDWARAGSAQGLAYTTLLGTHAGFEHVYVDRAPGDGPQPALVFIHGFGGNLKGYSWVLRKVAHDHGYALVAPTYGAGLWYDRGGSDTLDATWEWMAGTGQFDMDHVVLAGLSNGAFGVTGGVILHPDRWRGVAYLSGVVDADAMPEVARQLSAHPVPLLILHGARDDRVPLDYVQLGVDSLRAGGVSPTVEVVEDADHFLIFTHRARLEGAVGAWLDRVGGG